MKDYDNYTFYAITTISTAVVAFIVRWVYYKFKKVDDTEKIRARLDNHMENYHEFKEDTKTRLTKIEDRTYDQKK
jgi:hypothetical protein